MSGPRAPGVPGPPSRRPPPPTHAGTAAAPRATPRGPRRTARRRATAGSRGRSCRRCWPLSGRRRPGRSRAALAAAGCRPRLRATRGVGRRVGIGRLSREVFINWVKQRRNMPRLKGAGPRHPSGTGPRRQQVLCPGLRSGGPPRGSRGTNPSGARSPGVPARF